MFCPQSVVWGDVGTWVSGGGALIASLMALYLSGKADRREEESRRNQKAADDARARRVATAIAIEINSVVKDLDRFGSIYDSTIEKPGFDTKTATNFLISDIEWLKMPVTELHASELHFLNDAQQHAVTVMFGKYKQLERSMFDPKTLTELTTQKATASLLLRLYVILFAQLFELGRRALQDLQPSATVPTDDPLLVTMPAWVQKWRAQPFLPPPDQKG